MTQQFARVPTDAGAVALDGLYARLHRTQLRADPGRGEGRGEDMTADPFDLERFVRAQDPVVADVLTELRAARKTGHWIWFIFPQLLGLGRSRTSRFYAMRGLEEARAYLAHPVLGPRLLACVDAVLAVAPGRAAVDIFGKLDARKVQSSMTLFSRADPDEARFAAMLRRFYDGERDAGTDAALPA